MNQIVAIFDGEKIMSSESQSGDKHSTNEQKNDLLDPSLLKSAREIYYTYCHFNDKRKKSPIGVAIDRKTHKGQLLFTKRPILLPDEYFISVSQLES